MGAAYAYLAYSIARTLTSILALKISLDEKKRLIETEVSEPVEPQAKKI